MTDQTKGQSTGRLSPFRSIAGKVQGAKYRGKAGSYLLAILVLITLSYFLPRLLPGDFVTSMYSGAPVTLTALQEAELKAFYAKQEGFGRYVANLLSLNWGYSYAFLAPVSRLVFDALPWTLLLIGSAHLLASIFGFIAGVEAAWRGGVFEKVGVWFMTLLEGIPEMCLGVLLLLFFALHLGWFPAAGAETAYGRLTSFEAVLDVIHHLILPLATLIVAYLPGNFLLARGSMIMTMGLPFVTTARAKGLTPRRVRYAHGARNALLPLATRFGLRIGFLLTGALVVETVFSYPGLGTLLFKSIAMRDLPLIQGIVLFSSALILAVNLALEFLYGWLDPRVRHAS
ncbi:MAG: ABC transporter permease [Smithellaceae bacterium]|nr:ABC transporter permease [Smithellaceae bacterium]